MDLMLNLLIVLLVIIPLFNQKIDIKLIVFDYIQILKNDNTKKTSIFDIISFVVIPIAISILLVLHLDYEVDFSIAQSLMTVFSLIAAMLFTFLAIFISKEDEASSSKKKQVIKETSSAIGYSIMLSILLCIILVFVSSGIYILSVKVTSIITLSMSLMLFFNVFVILKRVFLVFSHTKWILVWRCQTL